MHSIALTLERAMPANVRAALTQVSESFCIEYKKAGFWVNVSRLFESYGLIVLTHDFLKKWVRLAQPLRVWLG